MSGEIVDEGDEISTPADAHVLYRSPHIQVDKIKLILIPILLIGEWKLMLLPELAYFTYLAISATKSRQLRNHLFRMQFMKLPQIDVANPLVPQIDI